MTISRARINKSGDVAEGLPVYTTGAIARLLNASPRTVAQWIDTGDLKGYRLPGSADRRVPGESLLAFCQGRGLPVPPELLPRGCLTVGLPEEDVVSLRRLLDMPTTAAADIAGAGWHLARLHVSAIIIDQAIGREALRHLLGLLAGIARRADRSVIVVAAEDTARPPVVVKDLQVRWLRRPVGMGDVVKAIR